MTHEFWLLIASFGIDDFFCRIRILTMRYLTFWIHLHLTQLLATLLFHVLLRYVRYNSVDWCRLLMVLNILLKNEWQDPIETERSFARRILAIVVCFKCSSHCVCLPVSLNSNSFMFPEDGLNCNWKLHSRFFEIS